MKKLFFCLLLCFISVSVFTQSVSTRIAKAYKIFESDSQLKNAIASLYIIDAKTGKVVFDKNAQVGLAPASTQKVITAATAYELLGKDFSFTTQFGYTGKIENGSLNGSFYIKGSGDPTLGSWRWAGTNEQAVVGRVVAAIGKLNIGNYMSFLVDANGWEGGTIPDGWIWQDIGNYYGAGADVINWRENQFDLVLRSGNKIGDRVSIVETKPAMYSYAFSSYATAAAKGTGDNAYIYFPLTGSQAVVRGTIPVNEDRFVISGAMPSGRNQFLATLMDSLSARGIQRKLSVLTIDKFSSQQLSPDQLTIFHEERSPVLDSMVYWFLRRSINLYGEAFVKAFARQEGSTATTDKGVDLMRDLWKSKGIPASALNLVDGSGLSPLNRTTTHAQVKVLQYARKQPWFHGYYQGFPEFNHMKMKSGTINGVKGFCGYHRSSGGQEYIFSFIVNNYQGPASSLVQKMYKVLDELK